jgi:hypothetical protein
MFPSSDDGWETPTLLGPLDRANLNQWATEQVSSAYHLRSKTDLFSDMLCFLVFRIPVDGQSPESQ